MTEKEKVPKYPKTAKYSRNEQFSSNGIEDVCLKDKYTMNSNNILDINMHNYRTLCDLLSH